MRYSEEEPFGPMVTIIARPHYNTSRNGWDYKVRHSDGSDHERWVPETNLEDPD